MTEQLVVLAESAMDFAGVASCIVLDAVRPAQSQDAPNHRIAFAMYGSSHNHIYSMIGTIQRGGGEMVAAGAGKKKSWWNLEGAFLTSRSPRRGTRSLMIRPSNSYSLLRSPVSVPTLQCAQ